MCNENALVTVVVPAYNVEKYIGECLDSLLHQTVTAHKVIVVNDGSTDETGKIAKKYADAYPNMICYVEQENKGLGAARNAGMKLVDTKYVTFLDSDDWLDCHFVECVVRELEKHDEMADIVFTLPWVYDSLTHQVQNWADKVTLEQLFYPGGGYESVGSAVVTKDTPNWMRMYLLEASACRRIFRTHFLKEIRYQFIENTKWEDVWPHFHAIHCAKRCIAVKSSGFVYRVNIANQITSGGGASRLDVAPVFAQILETAIKENWANAEIAYIIRTFRSFTDWSIQVTNTDYIVPVLKSLHTAYCNIPKHCLKIYRQMFHMGGKDAIMIHLLRSPFYGLLKDYRMRTAGIRLFSKLKHLKAIVRR